MAGRPPPPKKAAKPGQVKVYRAAFDYKAQQADELTFSEGDLLYVYDSVSDPAWWKAKCNGKDGLIPSNYVEAQAEVLDNPIHDASKRGNVEFVTEAVAAGVSVNGLDRAGCTPLHWAARGAHRGVVEVLLGVKNVEVNIQNKLGDTPLHNAAYKGDEVIVQMLLDRGADPSVQNEERQTPKDLASTAAAAAVLAASGGLNEDYGQEDDED